MRGFDDASYHLPEGVRFGDDDLTVTVDAPNASSYEIAEADPSNETKIQIRARIELDLTTGG